MTTSTQLIAWLKSDTAKRCVLIRAGVQVAGTETTRYLSNKNYKTYIPCVCGGVTFSENLPLDFTPGQSTLSSGTIEFNNINGEIDSWLDDVWKNRPIQVLIGDEFWAEEDFYLIFDGVIAEQPNTNTDDRMKVTLTLSDKLQRLNTTVSDVKLGGTSPNADKLIPLLFGECFNITPLLVDLATHKYQIHNGPIERIIEVRDNGIPVGFTPSLSTGTFVLTQQPVGTITCDAQGDNPGVYVDDVVGLIRRLAKSFGDVDKRFTDAELYLTADLSDSLPGSGARILDDVTSSSIVLERQVVPGAIVSASAAIGVYLTEKTNLLDLCNQIASSIGARVAMTRTGLLYVVRIQLPQPNTGTAVTAADMRERSLRASTVPVVASVQLGYSKNYTVQTAIAEGCPSDQISLYAKDWPFTATYSDSVTAAKFKLILNPTQVDTLLQAKADADLETARRGALFGVQRYVVSYDGTPHLMLEGLGSAHTIQHRRFGLASGRVSQIISINTDWLNAKVTIGVLL